MMNDPGAETGHATAALRDASRRNDGMHAASADEVELTVLMPCLNEAETLETCIRKAQRCIEQYGVKSEIVIADNGSTDGSQAIAERLGARVVPVAQRGYGAALYAGSRAARGRYIIMADADDSYDLSNLMPYLERLRAGDDLVMGNRFRGGIMPGAMPWKHRWIGNPVLTGIGRLFFKCPAGDFHCGMRGFSKTAFERMDLRTTGMEYASEMVIKANLRNMRISEVPTVLSPDGRSRPPHLRSWRDGWRHLRFMLLYCPRWLFLIPGLLLMAAGAATCAWLLPGPRTVGGVTFDVHTLLAGAMAILVGYGAVAFAMYTKIFAITEGLLPEDPRLTRLFRYVFLETGLLAGAALLLGGGGLFAMALLRWRAAGFGPLDYQASMRWIIPACTLLTLGVQTVFSSFFLSVLGLRRREMPSEVAQASP
jgi:hypothetical protein